MGSAAPGAAQTGGRFGDLATPAARARGPNDCRPT